jgi:hypothetical protein
MFTDVSEKKAFFILWLEELAKQEISKVLCYRMKTPLKG